MNQSIPLYLVLALAASAVLLWLVNRWVQAIVKSAGRTAEAVEANTVALNEFTEALGPAAKEIQAEFAAVPKLLEAVARIGHALLEAQQQQQRPNPHPFGKPNGPAPPRDTAAANMEYEVDRLVRGEGITREEALMRLNPANAGSVWEGNQFFANWGTR